jgi:hypothetical protein
MATGARTFTSAALSPYQAALQSEAKNAGISIDDLRELLAVINADPDLIAFPTACESILEICQVIESVWKAEPSSWGLHRWVRIAHWVVVSREKLAIEIGGSFDPQPKSKGESRMRNAMIGNGVDRHTLYAMLLSSHKGSLAEKQRFRLLQAHLLTGVITSLRRKYRSRRKWFQMISAYEAYGMAAEWRPLGNSIRDVCLTVRRMAEDRENYPSYFNALPVSCSTRKFADKFLQDTHLSSIAVGNEWLLKRHQPLQIFLRKVFKDLKFKELKKAPNTSHTSGAILRESQEIGTGFVHQHRSLGDPDDNYANKSKVNHSVRCKKKTSEEVKQALDADDDPFVDEGEEDIYEKAAESTGQRTPSICTWNQLQPIAMQNQLLPLSYGNLAKAEARQVVRESEHWLAQTEGWLIANPGSSLKPRQLLELRLWILLLTILATGSSQDRTQALYVFPPGVHDRPAELALFLPNGPSACATWRLAVIDLPYKHHPESAKNAKRSQSQYMHCPDVLGVSRFVELLLKQSDLSGAGRTALQPLRGRAAKVLRELKKRLAKIDPEGRLTVSKLSGFLFSQMMIRTDGDVTASAILARQNLPIARTRLFYACIRLRRMQEAYVDVFREIGTYAHSAVSRIQLDDTDTWIATRPCPTREAVQALVFSLLRKMDNPYPYRENERYATYHNAMVLYTFLFQAYSIGTRAVNSPILDFSRVAADGFAWVDDKDTGAHYNAHLALCPEPFHKHLKMFDKHLEAVRRELSWKITKRGDLERLGLPCFFLRNTESGIRVEEVTRGSIELKFKELKFGFPVNVHRRFVSGELLDGMVVEKVTEDHPEQLKWNGVAPEFVDWWMSHWSVGEEPWTKSSSLSLEAYKRGIEEPLSKLLEDLGFQPKPTALDVEGVAEP